jgi:hypothetical protein
MAGFSANSSRLARVEGGADCTSLGAIQLGLIIYTAALPFDAQRSVTLVPEISGDVPAAP